ncbi:MAG TPA: FAD-dependent oxidoreductase, partial [Gammaproteobacteria bacterium]|nr:FAD-dependent oxidoreductase [Gammaproteobacteria bacterium]
MEVQSLWHGISPPADFPALTQDIDADVVVIGGGITGVTVAERLRDAGKQVVLLEAGRIGGSTTGGSTGNLYATIDEHLFRLREKWNPETVRAVVESRQSALALIASLLEQYRIECGFARRSWHLYATPLASADAQDAVEHELDAAREAGLDARLVLELPLPFAVHHAVVIDGQAQINPLAYVRALARAAADTGCRIFEQTTATYIDAKEGVVETHGGRVKAEAIVLATHTPKGVYAVQAAMVPAREYAVAGRLTGAAYPEGIFWSADEPKHSIRSFETGGERHLLVIGEKHLTGKEARTDRRYDELESFALRALPLTAIDYRWSAQHYRSADMLPYIGKSMIAPNVYIATGFATDGLIYGTLAASMIADAIDGRDNPWHEIYKPNRFTPGKSAKRFLQQNVEIMRQYGRKLKSVAEYGQFDAIAPGHGAIVQERGSKLAAWRDDDG